MPAFLSPSQRASQQAAASLLVDEGETPYHNSQPIARFPLDDNDEVFVPVRRVQHAAKLGAACSPLSPAAEECPFNETEKDAAWTEVLQSSRSSQLDNHSGTHVFYPNRHCSARLRSGSGTDGGGLQYSRTPRARSTSTVDQRQIDRLAIPRGVHGTVMRPAVPNYGRLLNMTEEEERDRLREQQRYHKSLRTLKFSMAPCVERAQPARAQPPPSCPESKYHTAPATAASSAAQKAYYEKLTAPKKAPPLPAADSGAPLCRTPLAAIAPSRDINSTLDRLAMPKKTVTARSEEATAPPQRGTLSHSSNARAPTQLHLQRLSHPKQQTASSHHSSHVCVEYNSYISRKRYYGGTTVISATSDMPSSTGLQPSPSHVSRRHSGRVSSASWNAVASRVERRGSSTRTSSSMASAPCAVCGTAAPQQAYRVLSQPIPFTAAASHRVTVEQAAVLLPQSHPPAPADNENGSTRVQSTPAKCRGSKPPILVHTRRYVPPLEEQDAEAADQLASRTAKQESPEAPAPAPVEAVRRRSATLTVSAEMAKAPALEKEQQEGSNTTSVETPGRAPLAPVVVQAAKRASPPPSAVLAEVTAPQAVVQATKQVSSRPAAPALSRAPQGPLALETPKRQTPAPCPTSVAPRHPAQRVFTDTHPSLTSASSPVPASDKVVTAPPPSVATPEKYDTVTAASAFTIEEVHAIPPSPCNGKAGPRKITHRKPHRVKPEVLQDADFAFQLEEVLPELRLSVPIVKKPKRVTKMTALRAPPSREH
ncbi:hypothetical protein, conserved [Leishmania lindenbergi]|uniref:TPX2 C-terminal domain-containing protein n=1 Tax=Leishmania lindenbergi TaxID=651832 RepID=A0AAW3A663_9TRYP